MVLHPDTAIGVDEHHPLHEMLSTTRCRVCCALVRDLRVLMLGLKQPQFTQALEQGYGISVPHPMHRTQSLGDFPIWR